MNLEKWCWTELVAFENTDADCGAGRYLDALGFIPDGISLFVWHGDFVFSHKGMDEEYMLPPPVCSRHAHPGNEDRARQVWTNWKLRTLVQALESAGCATYFSVFTTHCNDEYNKEWITDYPEAFARFRTGLCGERFNLLARLNDGTLLEDIFIPQTVRICRDYGFTGWHGADRCNGHGLIYLTDSSDSIVRQAMESKKWQDVPECMIQPCNDDPEILQARLDWIWANRKRDWIDFNQERWFTFWRKMITALHEQGLKGMINSTYTKGNFDAACFYGIDYRKIAGLGVDGIICETSALGMSIEGADIDVFDDFQAMFLEIKAYAPDWKIIFLHAMKDVVEAWDHLRNMQSGYERELFVWCSCYYRTSNGALTPTANGLLACLADGLKPYEWQYVRERWDVSYRDQVTDAGSMTMLWDDSMVDRGIDDYLSDNFPQNHDIATRLMENKVNIQIAGRFENSEKFGGILFLPAAHLVAPARLDRLVKRSEPLILCGRHCVLAKYFSAGEVVTDGNIATVILNNSHAGVLENVEPGSGLEGKYEKWGCFLRVMPRLAIRPEFWEASARKIIDTVKEYRRKNNLFFAEIIDADDCRLLTRMIDDNTMEVGVENRLPWRLHTRLLRFSKPLDSVEIISCSPLYLRRVEKDQIFLPVPVHGITILRVSCKNET